MGRMRRAICRKLRRSGAARLLWRWREGRGEDEMVNVNGYG